MSTVFSGKRWSIQRFISGFANNGFLITCLRTGKSVIVDTPAHPDELVAASSATQVEAILITHGHSDHLEGFAAVTDVFGAPVGIGTADREMLPASAKRVSEYLDISTNRLIEVGDIALRPMATPGHTPGSTCFVLGLSPRPEVGAPDSGESVSHVFTGDTLFPGGPGRSASPDALRQMLDSINGHIYVLPDSTVILPGHGEFTTIGDSKREYAVFAARPVAATLYGDVTWA